MDHHEDVVRKLKEDLENSEQNLGKAAEIGKMLLAENEALTDKLEELRKQNDKRLEVAEQSKYELQTKLDQKMRMDSWYNEEIAHLRQQVAEGQDNLRKTLETERNLEVSKLTRQLEELRAEIDHYQGTEARLLQKNEELEVLLQEKLNQTEIQATSKSFSQSEDLQEEMNTLQFENTSLKSQLIDIKSELQSVQSDCEIIKGKLISRDEELEDICRQFSLANKALENTRMEKLELNSQLDALRMETSNHKSKGNSIFSEVEDRRVEAEKKLISLQVKYETIKEKFNVEKQQNHKYKRQISQLLMQMRTGNVEYVDDLTTKLSQARQEIREQMELITQLQEKQNCPVKEKPAFTNNTGSGDEEYVQYLQTLITGKENELQKVKEELRIKNLQFLDEQSRTTAQNSKIVQIEAEKDKVQGHNIKLSLKLDELRLKYEPDAVKKSGALEVKRSERIPVEDSVVKITETSRIHDNSTLSQSQTSFHQKIKQQTQPLVETQTNNIHNEPIIKKKGKTVSISDDVEEHEIDFGHEIDGETISKKENESVNENQRNVPKGKRPAAVKHISADKMHGNKNDCKTQ